MYRLQGYLASRFDTVRRAARQEDGQATVEYVGMVVVVGTGIGLVTAKLNGLGFGVKIGNEILGGVLKGIKSVFG